MSIEQLGHIDAEGGPLLLIDGALARFWKGNEEGGSDYQKACNIFDAEPSLEGAVIPVSRGTGILWEMEGAGTAYLFKENNSHFIVLRPWINDPNDTSCFLDMAKEPRGQSSDVGSLVIQSGALLAIWAAENGSCVESLEVETCRRPTGEMSMETSGLLVQVGQKVFRCFHDKIETKAGYARRLHLVADHD